MSQLDLAIVADTTSRHVSFLETGRSRPSPAMVERLVEALQVPIRNRNAMFHAAGLSGPYRSSEAVDLETPGPFRGAIEAVLAQHDPFPALAFDSGWNVVMANTAGADLLGAETNLIRATFSDDWKSSVQNWPSVAWATLGRLRHDGRQLRGRPDLDSLIDFAQIQLSEVPRPTDVGDELVVCPIFLINGWVIPTITMTARFGVARSVTADELQVELIFPADDVGRRFFDRGLNDLGVGRSARSS